MTATPPDVAPLDLARLTFDAQGLIPAVVQDATTGEVRQVRERALQLPGSGRRRGAY